MISGRQLTLSDYLLMVRRRIWLLVVLFVIVFFGTALVCFLLPNTYRATTLILVEAQKVPESYVRSTVSSPMQARLRTITQQIMSQTRLEQVIRELHLTKDLQDREALERYVREMRSHIWIEVKESDAFTIAYMDKAPHTAMLVANRLAALFIEENLTVREQFAVGTTEFLAHELERIRTLLEEQEKGVSEFKQKHVEELPGQREINKQALERLQPQLQTTLDALEQVRNRKTLLAQQTSTLKADADAISNALTYGAPADTSSTAVNPLEQELAQRRRVLAELQLRFSDQYPDIKSLKREVAELEARLSTDRSVSPTRESVPSTEASLGSPRWGVQEMIKGLQKEIQEQIQQVEVQEQKLRREEASVRQRIAAYEQKIANTALREQELMVLSRDYESTRRNYEALLAGEMQAKVAENLEKRQKAEQFRVLDPAKLPTRPWKPERLKILVMGLVLGLGVGCGAVFVTEYLDHSFHNPEDLKQFTALPVLVSIPLLVTTVEQQKRQLRWRFFYAACICIPAVAIATVYFLGIQIELVFNHARRLLQL